MSISHLSFESSHVDSITVHDNSGDLKLRSPHIVSNNVSTTRLSLYPAYRVSHPLIALLVFLREFADQLQNPRGLIPLEQMTGVFDLYGSPVRDVS